MFMTYQIREISVNYSCVLNKQTCALINFGKKIHTFLALCSVHWSRHSLIKNSRGVCNLGSLSRALYKLKPCFKVDYLEEESEETEDSR